MIENESLNFITRHYRNLVTILCLINLTMPKSDLLKEPSQKKSLRLFMLFIFNTFSVLYFLLKTVRVLLVL